MNIPAAVRFGTIVLKFIAFIGPAFVDRRVMDGIEFAHAIAESIRSARGIGADNAWPTRCRPAT